MFPEITQPWPPLVSKMLNWDRYIADRSQCGWNVDRTWGITHFLLRPDLPELKIPSRKNPTIHMAEVDTLHNVAVVVATDEAVTRRVLTYMEDNKRCKDLELYCAGFDVDVKIWATPARSWPRHYVLLPNDIRAWHLIQSILPRLDPTTYEEITADQKVLLRALTHRTPKAYLEAVSQMLPAAMETHWGVLAKMLTVKDLTEQYDRAAAKHAQMTNLLIDLERQWNDALTGYYVASDAFVSAERARQTDYSAQIKEFSELLTANRAVRWWTQIGSAKIALTFVAPVTNFDAEPLAGYIRSCRTSPEVAALLRAIFIEDRVRLIFKHSFDIDLSHGGVVAATPRDHQGTLEGLNNPHGTCMGTFKVPINRALQERDWPSVIANLSLLTGHINFFDNVISRSFVNGIDTMYASNNPLLCIGLPDGKIVTVQEGARWVEDNPVGLPANDPSTETEPQTPGQTEPQTPVEPEPQAAAEAVTDETISS
jgi:hypothetical protein